MRDDDIRWMNKCEEFPEKYKIIVDNDEVYVVDKTTDEDVYTFSEYGWRFALSLLRYIGVDAEEC